MIRFKRFLIEEAKKKKPKYQHISLGFNTKASKAIDEQWKFSPGKTYYPEDEDEYEYDKIDKLRTHYEKAGLTEKHPSRLAIKDYSGNGHDGLNRILYEKKPGPDKHLTDMDRKLSEVLRSVVTPHHMYVYTGVKSNMFDYKPHPHTGHIHVEHAGYTSTSLSSVTASDFAKEHEHGEGDHVSHVLRIHVPEGSHGAYIAHLSKHPEEHEVLLHKHARFDIHPEPDVEDKWSGKHNKYIKLHTWHARLVHDGVKPTRHEDQEEFDFMKDQ